MLGTKFSKNKKAQHGSVMLEVIAVLALMGVMGSMLFRQIYQRNQELHNIQMASEIRTVKEAFSAYIQAYRAVLLKKCDGKFEAGSYGYCGKITDDDISDIADYLPSGWFEERTILDFYQLFLVTYQQMDSSQKKVVIGFVVPTENTLPTTGWNFKRAARVALLVGADGGVFGKDKMTQEKIVGAMGAWEISVGADATIPDFPTGNDTYVAMTGLDVFTPEYELPEGKVKLPEDWDLATQKLGAWNYFSAGGGKAGCYSTIEHDQYDADGDIGFDIIKSITDAGCSPLFYVDNTTSKVFVNNDLEIGSGTTTNLTLTQEGVIKQKGGLTIDADGRIISKDELATDIGDLKQKERYLLDPAHTSVMNDIYLTSRGGVRLSDILPNYILKEVKTITGGDDITIPTCPTGYKKAIVVTPVSWDQGEVTFKKGSSAITATSFPVAATTADLTELKGTVSSVPGEVTFTASSLPVAATTADLTELKGTVTEGICVKITETTSTTDGLKAEESTKTGEWTVVLGYKNDDDSCISAVDIKAIAQTYCVFEPTMYTTEASCKSAGLIWESDVCKAEMARLELTKVDCEAAGFTWDNASGCRYVYASCNIINTGTNNGTNIENKPAVCKAAGCNWDGTTCSDP